LLITSELTNQSARKALFTCVAYTKFSFFFQVFAKNILEEEKKFDSGTRFFFWKIVPNWVYFGQGEDFKQITELSEKVQYSRNRAIKNSL